MNRNVSLDDTGLIISATAGHSNDTRVISYHWPALFLVSFSLIGIIGNLLVCLAIGTERRLQNRTNWFLFSLAFADMLISGLVIPLAIVKEFAGLWLLGPVLCDLWIFFDVCSCTSSIMHIVVISIDRYLAIHDPLNVRSRQENSQVLLLIGLIWFIAIFLSSPMIVLGLINPYNIFINGQCLINNQFFVIYGSVVSFVIPLVIVIVVYVLTVRRLKEQIRQCREQFTEEPLISRASLVARPFVSQTALDVTTRRKRFRRQQRSYELSEVSLETSFITREEPPASKISPHAEYACPTNPFCQLKCTCSHPTLEAVEESQTESPTRVTILPSPVRFRNRRRSPLRSTRSLTRANSLSIRNERKALKVLGVVFVIFVVAWFPFCILNLLHGVCKRCSIAPTLLNSFVWLGYVSSSINPLVYTIFNRNFRVKFLALLQCQCFSRPHYQSHSSLPGSRFQRMNEIRRARSDTVSS